MQEQSTSLIIVDITAHYQQHIKRGGAVSVHVDIVLLLQQQLATTSTTIWRLLYSCAQPPTGSYIYSIYIYT